LRRLTIGGQNRRRQSRAYATLVKLDAIDVVGGDGASIRALRTRGGISPAGLSARYRWRRPSPPAL
jgi:hypothetical protein